MWEKSSRTSPGKSKLPSQGMDSNGELGRGIKFLLNSREFAFLVQIPECCHKALQGFVKKKKKRRKSPGGAWNSCFFSSFSKSSWLRRDEGSLLEFHLKFLWHLVWINTPQINIPVYFLGTTGHGIFISPGKGIEENPEIFGKQQENSSPCATPRSSIAHSKGSARGFCGILVFHPLWNAVFPKFPALQRTGGFQFKSWTTWNNHGMIPDVFPGSPIPAGFLPGHSSSQSK